jgi:hypothetical protein
MCAGPGPIAASATSVSRRRGGPIGGTSQSAAIGEKRKPTPSHAHVVKRRRRAWPATDSGRTRIAGKPPQALGEPGVEIAGEGVVRHHPGADEPPGAERIISIRLVNSVSELHPQVGAVLAPGAVNAERALVPPDRPYVGGQAGSE